MGLRIAIFLSSAVGPPVDVKNDQSSPNSVLIGELGRPRFVFGRPCDFVVVGKLCFISWLELLLEYLLLGGDLCVLIVASPVVEVVVAVPEGSQRGYSSQHIYYKSILMASIQLIDKV